jgi:hypothetical protein
MKNYSKLVQGIRLPKMIPVCQSFERPMVADIEKEVRTQLAHAEIENVIRPGMSIALTCGSRGIANIVEVTRIVAAVCKERGAYPFIVPAMGSHGGAAAQGQREILESLGVSEEACDCPIRATMEVVEIGKTTERHPVFIDRFAAEADGIIVIARVKPHTCFRGVYESGLMKMMTIGLGKQQGAEVCHFAGFSQMHLLVPLFGRAILKHARILLGLALVENAYEQTAEIRALTPAEIPDEEPILLKRAKALLGRILLPQADVLVVDRIGKNISGDGADPNVTGRYGTEFGTGGLAPQRQTALDLTEESHGNASGVGLFDAITERLFQKMRFDTTYPNAITSKMLHMLKVPPVMETDRDCIAVAVQSCYNIDHQNPRIIRIHDTMTLDHIWISQALREAAEHTPGIQIDGPADAFPFDAAGNLF